jgi:hypothetical protein
MHSSGQLCHDVRAGCIAVWADATRLYMWWSGVSKGQQHVLCICMKGLKTENQHNPVSRLDMCNWCRCSVRHFTGTSGSAPVRPRVPHCVDRSACVRTLWRCRVLPYCPRMPLLIGAVIGVTTHPATSAGILEFSTAWCMSWSWSTTQIVPCGGRQFSLLWWHEPCRHQQLYILQVNESVKHSCRAGCYRASSPVQL